MIFTEFRCISLNILRHKVSAPNEGVQRHADVGTVDKRTVEPPRRGGLQMWFGQRSEERLEHDTFHTGYHPNIPREARRVVHVGSRYGTKI
jgi:hypothetical protein